MADREVSFVRHGDSVVWVSTENGVTETRTEYAPLEIRDSGNPFLADTLAQLEGTRPARPEPAHLAAPVFREGPTPAATPVPARTTVVTVAGNTGTRTKTIQHGPPFTGGMLVVAFFVLVSVMAWALLMRKPTTG